MLLEQIKILNFRNYKHADVNIENTKTIILLGENGQGKTNFLEVLHCLSYGSSFRKQGDDKLVQFGQTGYKLRGIFREDDIKHDLFLDYDGKQKKIILDGTRVQNRQDLLDFYPCVTFKHSDFFILVGSTELQRQYLDQTLALCSLPYLDALRNYNRCLRQKNAALKQQNKQMALAYNQYLIRFGLVLLKWRSNYLVYLQARVRELFKRISGTGIDLNLSYAASWKEQEEEAVQNHLEKSIQSEMLSTVSLSGPHRDKITVLLDGHALRHVASTGQTRLISLLLRTVQSEYYVKKKQALPVYLFDDVLLEIDKKRQQRFLEELPETRQAFFTFLPDETIPQYMGEKVKKFFIQNGVIQEQE